MCKFFKRSKTISFEVSNEDYQAYIRNVDECNKAFIKNIYYVDNNCFIRQIVENDKKEECGLTQKIKVEIIGLISQLKALKKYHLCHGPYKADKTKNGKFNEDDYLLIVSSL
ncbi:MAG: hypothetical protein MJ201_01025 [Mycoplasmoidaceae bacterium]|nr:hypothetical protein [Mycoplasmoidaceae bacterium]